MPGTRDVSVTPHTLETRKHLAGARSIHGARRPTRDLIIAHRHAPRRHIYACTALRAAARRGIFEWDAMDGWRSNVDRC